MPRKLSFFHGLKSLSVLAIGYDTCFDKRPFEKGVIKFPLIRFSALIIPQDMLPKKRIIDTDRLTGRQCTKLFEKINHYYASTSYIDRYEIFLDNAEEGLSDVAEFIAELNDENAPLFQAKAYDVVGKPDQITRLWRFNRHKQFADPTFFERFCIDTFVKLLPKSSVAKGLKILCGSYKPSYK